MTNREKLKELFPYLNIVGTVFTDKRTEQVLAASVNFNWLNAEYKEPTTKNDLALIHTEGLDEEIRCTMCTNSMKSDRGCDGSCVVNKDMYMAVMDAIEKRIQPITRNCFGCKYSKDNHNADTEECHLCMWENQHTPITKNDLGVNKTFYEQMVEYCNEHFLVLVEKDVWEDAKKALTTKNNLGIDCISRADLYNRIKKIDHDEDYECDEFGGSKITYHTCDWDEVLREIEDAPSVTPQESRKGHWIYTPQQRLVDETDDGCVYETDYRCSCSECGGDFGFIKNKDAFCKFCGADMRGEK